MRALIEHLDDAAVKVGQRGVELRCAGVACCPTAVGKAGVAVYVGQHASKGLGHVFLVCGEHVDAQRTAVEHDLVGQHVFVHEHYQPGRVGRDGAHGCRRQASALLAVLCRDDADADRKVAHTVAKLRGRNGRQCRQLGIALPVQALVDVVAHGALLLRPAAAWRRRGWVGAGGCPANARPASRQCCLGFA